MLTKDRLIDCELNLFCHYANRITAEFGYMFYNRGNPNSHDCNHAHIRHFHNIPEALAEIESFYVSIGITPRIFFTGLDGELDTLRPFLNHNAWNIDQLPTKTMELVNFHSQKDINTPLTVKKVDEISPDHWAQFVANDGGDWCAIASRDGMQYGTLDLFAGLLGDKVVGSVGIDHDRSNNLALVQDVFVNPNYRGKGLAAPLVAAALDYQLTHYSNDVYLWVENPIAVKVYEKLGFSFTELQIPIWRAWRDFSGNGPF